jgi:hypothetical protein
MTMWKKYIATVVTIVGIGIVGAHYYASSQMYHYEVETPLFRLVTDDRLMVLGVVMSLIGVIACIYIRGNQKGKKK